MKFLFALLLAVCMLVANLDVAAACTRYTVRRGDSGWRISSKLNVSFSRLQQLNPGVDLGRLRIGQILVCGTGSASSPNTSTENTGTGTERCKRLTNMFCGTEASCATKGGTLRRGQCSGRRADDNVCCDTSNVGSPSVPDETPDTTPDSTPNTSSTAGGMLPGPYAACHGRCLRMVCRGSRVNFSRHAIAGTTLSSANALRGRYSAHDLDILTRTLFGEANSEGRAGVAAVAWTIVNRMLSPSWPGTLARVCKQPMQYSCWNGGRSKRDMERLSTSSSSYRRLNAIAKDVLEGRIADFTGSANHYFASYISTPRWACNMTPTIVVGVHQYFRHGPKMSA